MRKRFLLECLLIALLVPTLVVWLARQPGIVQADQLVYDTMLGAAAQVPSSELLIVSIDDYSLDAIGPWPWQRSLHAKLLEALAAEQPKAVLFDLFFTTPSEPAQDQAFAAAIGKLPVYLPMQVEVPEGNPGADATPAVRRYLPPLPMFAQAAAGFGHVNVALDSDSVARSIFLKEGPEGGMQPYLGLVLAQQVQKGKGESSILAQGSGVETLHTLAATPTNWLEQRPAFRLPFAGPRGTYRTVPYVSILRGEVPPELIRGKIILVGATARGFGDEVPSPNAGSAKFLPGVEVHANALDAMLNGNGIRVLQGNLSAGAEHGWHYALWIAVPTLLLWAVVLSSAGLGLLGLMVLSLSVIGLTFMGLQGLAPSRVGGLIWFAPMAPLFSLFLTYALWSWRRFADLYVYLGDRLKALSPLPVVPWLSQSLPARTSMPRESLDRALLALDRAVDDLKLFENFLVESIANLPIAVMVCDEAGVIRLSNERARSLISGHTQRAKKNRPHRSRREPFAGLSLPQLLDQLSSSPADLSVLPVQSGQAPQSPTVWRGYAGREFTSVENRVFKLDVVPLGQVQGLSTSAKGWIVAMPDLTADKKIEEQREQWLNFLSHDLRNPQVNILSLLDLHAIAKKEGRLPGPRPSDEVQQVDDQRLYQLIGLEVQRTIDMAESFIALNKAQGDAYKMDFIPLGAPLLDAIDQMTPQAVAKGVALQLKLDEADCFIVGDGTMLTRMFTNLISNALKLSESGMAIRVNLLSPSTITELDNSEQRAWVTIEDHGPGIAPEKLGELFSAFTTGVHAGTGETAPHTTHLTRPLQGIGLGLAFVKAVATRHGALVKVQSEVGRGSVFSVGFLIDKTPLGDDSVVSRMDSSSLQDVQGHG